MINSRTLAVLAAGVLVLAACAKVAPPTNTATDEAAVRDVETAWYKAYNGGDGAAVAALYAEDAVLNVPGAPPMRGAAIREYYLKDAPEFASSGHTDADGPTREVGVSGDLAWQWGTYSMNDKSGAALDAGKYLTVLQRRNGKWMIIRDIWNSDTPAPPK